MSVEKEVMRPPSAFMEAEPETLRELMEDDLIAKTTMADKNYYLIRLLPRTDIHFHYAGATPELQSAIMEDYLLYTDAWLKPDGEPSGYVRNIGAFTVAHHQGASIVCGAHIVGEHRRRGIGMWVYKHIINDMMERGIHLRSDFIRSDAAEALWRRIQDDNPACIVAVESKVGRGGVVYQAIGPVRRRPVHVRSHRRLK